MIFRKRKTISVFMNKIVILFLAVILIFCYIPEESYANLIEKGDIVTISEGRELKGSDGKPYYLASGYYTARFSNSSGYGFDYRVCRAISPKKVLLINNGKARYMGYCLEHGAWMNSGSTTYKGTTEKLKTLYWMKPYSESIIKWIELALLFGRQPGMTESDIPVDGCNLDDWYFATQNIIWEFQQGLRTSPDSIKSNPKTQEYNWYSKTMSGRPAYKLYKWMLTQMSKYNKNQSFTSTVENKAPLLKLQKNDDGTWSGRFTDLKKVGQDIVSENKHVKISRSGNVYTIRTDTDPGRLGTVSIKKTAKVNYGLLAFSSGVKSDISNHLQSIVWGAEDPVRMYIRLNEDSNAFDDNQPELPHFSVSISKHDKNSGFDGSNETGMGDAALNSTIAISIQSKTGTFEDSVYLDEYGKCDDYAFAPWLSVDDLTKSVNEDDDHTYITYTACAEVIIEESAVPDGRFTESESGTGDGRRSHIINYWAQSIDGGEYTYKIQSDGNTYTDISENKIISLKNDVFVNDNYRGRLQLVKTKTDLDPFTENGKGVTGAGGSSTNTGAGSDNVSPGKYSDSSRWTVRLLSGGYENNEYIRVIPLLSGENGFDEYSSNYKVTRDASGNAANADNPLKVSRFGRLNIVDLPYGSYEVKEISADSNGYVLEKFIVKITENGQLISTDVQNKPKENKIRVIKVNGETGKTVRFDGTSFRIKYLGNPDSDNPQADKNYGRYLTNGSNPKDGNNYIFNCDINGEVIIPYQLEYGKYQLEEITVPEGYYLDKDKNNKAFNQYEFFVNEQKEHTDGDDYITCYADVKMKNKPVRGKIEIVKSDETEHSAVSGATFEVYAAEDITEFDGVIPVKTFFSKDDSQIDLKVEKRDHAAKENPTEVKKTTLPSGSIMQISEKKAGMYNQTKTVYEISAEEGAEYKSEYEITDEGVKNTYELDCSMEYTAGGMSKTRIHVKKESEIIEEGSILEKTESLLKYGDDSLKLIDNILDDGSRIIQNASNIEEYDEESTVQEYDFTLINHYNSEKCFEFAFDEINIKTSITDGTSTTKIKSGDNHPEINTSSDYTYENTNNVSNFRCSPDNNVPVYFKTNDGIRTDMTLSGGKTSVTVKIMESQVKSFKTAAPVIYYNGSVIDWISDLTPENSRFEYVFDENNYIRAERYEKDNLNSEPFYIIRIVSNSVEKGKGFNIVYPDSTECEAVLGQDGKTAQLIFSSEAATMIYPKGSPAAILKTDETGNAVSGELPLGEYYILETASGQGYVNEGEWKKVALSYKDPLTSLVWNSSEFTNRKTGIRINIRKLFETYMGSKNYLPGSGAVFGVYSADNDHMAGKITSGKDGYATGIINAPEGRYYVKEISVPAGYKKSSEKYYFEVTDRILKPIEFFFRNQGIHCRAFNNLSGETIIHMEQLYRFPDEEIKSSAGTIKTASTDGRKIVEVRLKDYSDTEVFQGTEKLFSVKAEDKSFTISVDESLNAEVDLSDADGYTETRKDGQILFEFKPVVVRTEAITTGMFKNVFADDHSEYMVKSSDDKELVTLTVDKDRVLIHSLGNEKTVFKENAEQEISDDLFIKRGEHAIINYNNGLKVTVSIENDNSLSVSCAAGENRELLEGFSFLKDGQEHLNENSAVKTVFSKTYARTSSECSNICTFIGDIENDAQPQNEVEVPPEEKEGKLIIKKINAETGKALAGAEFDILGKDKKLIMHVVTDSKGKAEADKLKPGIYYYRETTAPEGYIKDNDLYCVIVKENQVTTVTVMNEKIEKIPNEETKPEKKENTEKISKKKAGSAPQTGDSNDNRFYILLIAALVLLTSFIAAGKRN